MKFSSPSFSRDDEHRAVSFGQYLQRHIVELKKFSQSRPMTSITIRS